MEENLDELQAKADLTRWRIILFEIHEALQQVYQEMTTVYKAIGGEDEKAV